MHTTLYFIAVSDTVHQPSSGIVLMHAPMGLRACGHRPRRTVGLKRAQTREYFACLKSSGI